MVNINIELPDDIHKRLKILSVTREIALKDLVVQALEESVKHE